jgi:hypothetical protein
MYLNGVGSSVDLKFSFEYFFKHKRECLKEIGVSAQNNINI